MRSSIRRGTSRRPRAVASSREPRRAPHAPPCRADARRERRRNGSATPTRESDVTPAGAGRFDAVQTVLSARCSRPAGGRSRRRTQCETACRSGRRASRSRSRQSVSTPSGWSPTSASRTVSPYSSAARSLAIASSPPAAACGPCSGRLGSRHAAHRPPPLSRGHHRACASALAGLSHPPRRLASGEADR